MAGRHIVLLVIINLIWGVNFIAADIVVDEFPPMLANTARFFLVTVFLLPFLRVVKGRMVPIVSIALLLGVLHFGLMMVAMAQAEGISALAIVNQLGVPFSTILAVVFLKETIGWKRTAGIAVSFMGVMILGFDPIVLTYWEAMLYMTGAILIYAFSNIQMRKLKDVKAATTQAWIGAAGFLGSLVLSLLFEEGQFEALSQAPLTIWGALLYTALGSSIIGHGGINYLLGKYEVSKVTPFFVLTPIFAVASGVIVFGEALTVRMIVGGIITIAGVAFITLRTNKKVADSKQKSRMIKRVIQ